MRRLVIQYGVHQFTPFGEINNQYSLGKFPSRVSEFSQNLLAEVRKHYSGRVGIGTVPPWPGMDFDISGYDYVMASIWPQCDEDFDISNPGPTYKKYVDYIDPMLQKYGVSELILGETGVFGVSESKEAKFYRLMLEQTTSYFSGYSLFYTDPTMRLRGRP